MFSFPAHQLVPMGLSLAIFTSSKSLPDSLRSDWAAPYQSVLRSSYHQYSQLYDNCSISILPPECKHPDCLWFSSLSSAPSTAPVWFNSQHTNSRQVQQDFAKWMSELMKGWKDEECITDRSCFCLLSQIQTQR